VPVEKFPILLAKHVHRYTQQAQRNFNAAKDDE
jgi:hypothetical protein